MLASFPKISMSNMWCTGMSNGVFIWINHKVNVLETKNYTIVEINVSNTKLTSCRQCSYVAAKLLNGYQTSTWDDMALIYVNSKDKVRQTLQMCINRCHTFKQKQNMWNVMTLSQVYGFTLNWLKTSCLHASYKHTWWLKNTLTELHYSNLTVTTHSYRWDCYCSTLSITLFHGSAHQLWP